MLTAAQKKVFETLLADKDFRGKDSLRHLLWLNTSNPKYAVGECYLVTDPGHSIFGQPVRNFRGKIIKVRCWRDTFEYSYELEGVVRSANGKEVTTKYFIRESEIGKPCEDNITDLSVDWTKDYADEMSIGF